MLVTEKTYAGIEDLRVLAINESLSPGGVVLADPKSWTDLGESLRLRVQGPAGRHIECTFRVRCSRLKMLKMCGRAKKLLLKIAGMEELGAAEMRGMGRTVRESHVKSPDGAVPNTGRVERHVS